MAYHKSAEKRNRQNERRRAINRSSTSTVRTAIKKLRGALSKNDAAEAQKALTATISHIDRAVTKGVLHQNAAARNKSRLTRHVQSLTSAK